MSEPAADPNAPAPVYAFPAALRIAAALVGFSLGVMTLGAMQKQDRARLETFEENTAVGDPIVLKLASPDQDVTIQFHGKPLGLVKFKHLNNHESRMERVGTDDAGAYRLYINKDEQSKSKPALYIKTGADEFMELKEG